MPPAAALLSASLEAAGIKFRMPAKTAAVARRERASPRLRFEDGSELAADLVVMAAGVRPNIELATRAGLRCERGILVDDTLQTYDPSIYAVGECVQHRNTTFGLVAPLWEQARVCAAHLAEVGVSPLSRLADCDAAQGRRHRGVFRGRLLGRDGSEALVLRDHRAASTSAW